MDRVKRLRRKATDAEVALWQCLRNRQLNVKFRRQHWIAGYIVDFVCIERALVIELDGGQHAENAAYDARRTAALEKLGYVVLRYWDNEALGNIDAVLDDIVAKIQARSGHRPRSNPPRGLTRAAPSPYPLPRKRGRGNSRRASH